MLPENASIRSEYRAPGGLLLIAGLFVVYTAIRPQLATTGFALSSLIYGAYGLGRLIGAATDGLPSTALMQAMILELVLGTICFGFWLATINPAAWVTRRWRAT